MRNAIKRIGSQRGLTMVELLVTLLIVALGSVMVATGIPVARDAYYSFMDVSNAQSLLSTTVTQLRDELVLAEDMSVTDNTISYTDESFDSHIISVASSDADVPNELLLDGESLALVGASSGSDTGNLYVTCSDINQSDTSTKIVEFTNICIYGTNSDETLATAESYAVKILTP